MPVTTPTNKLNIDGVPVYVKREDLFTPALPLDAGPVFPTDPDRYQYPSPPFAKLRGLMAHMLDLKAQGTSVVGYMDTSISMGGWAVAWCANALGLKAVIYYPDYKDGYRHNMEGHIRACAQSNAEILLLENPTQLSVNWYRARKLLTATYGDEAVLLPQGLPFRHTVKSVAGEVFQVPTPALGGSIVISVGSGTMAAGVLTGLNDPALGDNSTRVYGVMVSKGDKKGMARKVVSKAIGIRFGLDHRLHITNMGYSYEEPEHIQTPFPCNAYYDKKAWAWLVKYALHQLPRPILFWNIGADYETVYPARRKL